MEIKYLGKVYKSYEMLYCFLRGEEIIKITFTEFMKRVKMYSLEYTIKTGKSRKINPIIYKKMALALKKKQKRERKIIPEITNPLDKFLYQFKMEEIRNA